MIYFQIDRGDLTPNVHRHLVIFFPRKISGKGKSFVQCLCRLHVNLRRTARINHLLYSLVCLFDYLLIRCTCLSGIGQVPDKMVCLPQHFVFCYAVVCGILLCVLVRSRILCISCACCDNLSEQRPALKDEAGRCLKVVNADALPVFDQGLDNLVINLLYAAHILSEIL